MEHCHPPPTLATAAHSLARVHLTRIHVASPPKAIADTRRRVLFRAVAHARREENASACVAKYETGRTHARRQHIRTPLTRSAVLYTTRDVCTQCLEALRACSTLVTAYIPLIANTLVQVVDYAT